MQQPLSILDQDPQTIITDGVSITAPLGPHIPVAASVLFLATLFAAATWMTGVSRPIGDADISRRGG